MSEDEIREKVIQDMANCDFIRVRFCKDCKWYDRRMGNDSYALNWCKYHDVPTDDRGYCSWARG